jgi:hypothetical protein
MDSAGRVGVPGNSPRVEIVEKEAVEVDYLAMKQVTWWGSAVVVYVIGWLLQLLYLVAISWSKGKSMSMHVGIRRGEVCGLPQAPFQNDVLAYICQNDFYAKPRDLRTGRLKWG